MSSPDVAIVGAGAIGAAAAYELARQGARVVVLERSRDALGCSHGSAGLISPSHSDSLASAASIRHGLAWMTRPESPFHVRPRLAVMPWLARFAAASLPNRSTAASATLRALTAASLELHEQLARSGLPTSFERRGILSVYDSHRSYEQACRRLRARNGAVANVLGMAGARELVPALDADIAGAIYHPDEGHCDPSQFVHATLDAARELGAEVRLGVETLGLSRSGERVGEVQTTTGRIRADQVVLAAGVWTRELAGDVGVRLPLEGGKGYHIEVRCPPGPVTVPAFLEDAHVTVTPLAGRLRVTGTLDLSGTDLHVDPARLRAIAHAAGQTLRLSGLTEPCALWRGLRPCAPDGLPIIGRPSGLGNLVIATGHAMLGIALAPITAAIVSDLVCERPARVPIEDFAPSRFRPSRQLLHNQAHHRSLEI